MTQKNINFLITTIVIIFIFFIFFISLNKKNIYTNEEIKIKNIENFKTKELFSGNIIDFTSLIDKKKKDYSTKYLGIMVFTM